MRVLGVDPGANGGAVLRVDGVVSGCWAWTMSRPRGGPERWRLRSSGAPESRWTMGSMYSVGAALYGWTEHVDVLVLEGLYAPRRGARRASGADVVVLAERTGELLGPLRGIETRIERPTAREWRAMLGASELGYQAAEAQAIQAARLEGWLPRWTAAEQGAVAEAGVMAAWATRIDTLSATGGDIADWFDWQAGVPKREDAT